MVRAIRENRTPNLLALHYESSAWAVANLILIPSFAFPLSAIEKRKPLSATARRAGYVGLLDRFEFGIRPNVLLEIPADDPS
jgi:type II restriction enzyme